MGMDEGIIRFSFKIRQHVHKGGHNPQSQLTVPLPNLKFQRFCYRQQDIMNIIILEYLVHGCDLRPVF